MTDRAAIRRGYAARMTAGIAGIDPRVEAAFAAVPREAFAGAPPWTIIPDDGARREIATADVTMLYDNVLLKLDPSQGINNGSPRLHARMLAALDARVGDTVLHIGIGAGYYTAILAELAGASGHVIAVEYDDKLAEAAARNLRPWPSVAVVRGDGAAYPHDDADRIYVNFGVVAPPSRWAERLRDGGTLVFPLTAPVAETGPRRGGGVVLRLGRVGPGFTFAIVSPCGFIMAAGALGGTDAECTALAADLHDRRLRLGRGALAPFKPAVV